MRRIDTDLPGVCILEPDVHGDTRGYFFESFHAAKFAALGLDVRIAQTNVSRSARGVLRGLHYQWPDPQGKLVGVLEGAVWDVAADIRRGSPTFGRWTAVELSADNHRLFWIPPGYAHGFCVLSQHATFMYQCTTLYAAAADAGVRWNDDDLGITWPLTTPILSAKDSIAPRLREIDPTRLPAYTP